MLAYSPSATSTTCTRAGDPFNCRDADLVLLSSDGLEFKVHKKLIRLGSRVLSELIPLALPPPPSPTRRHRKQRPVLSLADTSDVLDLFLRFIYPIPEPQITLDEVYPLLELANKYGAPSIASRMRPYLLRPDHLEADPYVIYALASYAGMHDVAAVAARHTLPHPIPSTLKLTEMAEGSALVRLLEYRRRCAAAAASVARIADDRVPWWIQMRWRRLCFLGQCWECAKLLPGRRLRWDRTACGSLQVPEYWVHYMTGVGSALASGGKLDPGAARDARLVRPALESAMRCSKCVEKAWWDMEEFVGILADAIEEAIYSVKFMGAMDDDEHLHADARAMMKIPKTHYLSSDKPIYPLFDLFYKTYSNRIVEEDTSSVILEDDDHTVAPSSELEP